MIAIVLAVNFIVYYRTIRGVTNALKRARHILLQFPAEVIVGTPAIRAVVKSLGKDASSL